MPWNGVVGAAALVVLVAAWIFRRRRQPAERGPMPDVGVPPDTVTPIAQPHLEDTGLGAYSLRLGAKDRTSPEDDQGRD